MDTWILYVGIPSNLRAAQLALIESIVRRDAGPDAARSMASLAAAMRRDARLCGDDTVRVTVSGDGALNRRVR